MPGSYGGLIFNKRYPGVTTAVPDNGEIVRILGRIRILGQNTYFEGTDNQRLNRMIAVYSRRVVSENRVALPLYTRILLCVKCKNYDKDCQRYYYRDCHQREVGQRGPPVAPPPYDFRTNPVPPTILARRR